MHTQRTVYSKPLNAHELSTINPYNGYVLSTKLILTMRNAELKPLNAYVLSTKLILPTPNAELKLLNAYVLNTFNPYKE